MNKKEIESIKYYVKLHIDLHGNYCSWEDIGRDVLKNGYTENGDYSEIMEEVETQYRIIERESKEYGLFVGRCQPFTNGHNAIIQKIIRNGKIPIMILGSIDKINEKNPLSFEDRKKVIKKVYPVSGIKFIGLEDKNNWNKWFDNVEKSISDLKINKKQITLYAHNKEIDNKNFEHNGKQYIESSYTEIFKDAGYTIKPIDEVIDKTGDVIHASDIRNDEYIAKRNLDARVYRVLKDKYGWWK